MQNTNSTNSSPESSLNAINSLGETICNVTQNNPQQTVSANAHTHTTTNTTDTPEIKLPSYYDNFAKKHDLPTREEVDTLMALIRKAETAKRITDWIKIIAYIMMILSCIGAILPLAIELSKRKIILTSTGRRRSFSRRHRGSSAIARNGRSDQY